MTDQSGPPLAAYLGLILLVLIWLIAQRLLFRYSFEDDGICVYAFGVLRILLIRRDKIEWMLAVTWSDLLCGSMPIKLNRWKTFFVINSYFRKALIVKTTGGFYWILTPQSPDEKCDRHAQIG